MRPPERVSRFLRGLARGVGVDIIRARSNRWLHDLPVRTVLDVGANTGQFAHIARQLFPTSLIYSFEPLEDCFRELTNSFRSDSLWRGYRCALGAEEGEALLHRSIYSPSSSLLAMADLHQEAFPHTKGGRDERVPIHRLDDLLTSAELIPDVLFKLDVQGFEDRVLDGAMRVLATSEVVIVEVSFEHLYHEQASFEDVYERLRNAGFSFNGVWAQLVHPKDGRILQADAIFLRSSSS